MFVDELMYQQPIGPHMHHLGFAKTCNIIVGLEDIASIQNRRDMHSKCGINKEGDRSDASFIG